MIDSIQIVVLAIVQGITELLPISSTGHVLLTSKFLFNGQPDILLLTVLQFGTTVAILISFRNFLFKDTFKKEKVSLYLKVAVASLPAVILALLFEKQIESALYKPSVIAISLLVWGIAMIVIERFHKKVTTKNLTEVTYFQAISVGIAQAFAIIPGTSRSGSTTVVGILTGIEKFTSIQFSFLLGLPLLLGSFLYELYKFRNQLDVMFSPEYVLGMVISGVVGFVAIIVLSKFSKSNFLQVFGVYRIILSIVIFLTLVF
jgi:undecaprenyl-diphosphatase